MTEQFSFGTPSAANHSGEVLQLVGYMFGRGWVGAKQIKIALKWNDRKIRQIAHDSRGRVISGYSGYKLAVESTVEELEHAARRLRSQAAEMTRRSIQIDRYRHTGREAQ